MGVSQLDDAVIKFFDALHGKIRFVIDIVGSPVNGVNCECVVFRNVDRKTHVWILPISKPLRCVLENIKCFLASVCLNVNVPELGRGNSTTLGGLSGLCPHPQRNVRIARINDTKMRRIKLPGGQANGTRDCNQSAMPGFPAAGG